MKKREDNQDGQKPEIFALLLVLFGVPVMSAIGVNHFNNKYIATPYIIVIAIIYIFYRMEENAKKRISAN